LYESASNDSFVLLAGMPGKSADSTERKFKRALLLHKQGNLAQAKLGYEK